MLKIIKYKKIPFAVSIILVLLSVLFLGIYGLKPGIDFTGGSLLELSFSADRPSVQDMQGVLSNIEFDLGSPVVQPSGDNEMLIRVKFLTEDEHQELLSTIRESFSASTDNGNLVVESESVQNLDAKDQANDSLEVGVVKTETNNQILEERFETIGPAISSHLRSRAFSAIVAVVIAIIIYVAYAFRKVSKPVQSWKYGLSAIVALIHDIVIVLGVFAILGHFFSVEVGIPFVVALLTVLGYSVNDSIVVFDRVRENLIKRTAEDFDSMVELGINQTILRSINTSLTTLIVLFALFFFGGESIKYFALALIIGIASGTYSSIFLASPLLVTWNDMHNK